VRSLERADGDAAAFALFDQPISRVETRQIVE
jgi:hypothetical protein